MRSLLLLLLAATAASGLSGCALTGRTMGKGPPLYRDQPAVWHTPGGPVVVTAWSPRRPAGSVLVLSPGLDESARELHELGVPLAQRGVAVYAPDLRGQGLDRLVRPAAAGDFAAWPQWVADFRAVARKAAKAHPGVPLFYGGFSSGALVALQAAAEPGPPVAGLALSSPAAVLLAPPFFLRPALALVGALSLNRFRITTPAGMRLGAMAAFSRPLEETAWERSPDRVGAGFTARSLQAYFALGAGTLPHLPAVQAPALLLFGEQDPVLGRNERARRRRAALLTGRLPAATTTARWYGPGRHDLLNDSTTREMLVRDIDGWLEGQRRGAAGKKDATRRPAPYVEPTPHADLWAKGTTATAKK